MNELNIGQLFARRASINPSLEATVEIEREHRLTYAELNALTNRCAHVLVEDFGVSAGDRIALLLPTCSEFIAMFYAAAKIGAVVVPLNTRLAGSELAYILENCGASVLVFHPLLGDLVAAIRAADEHAPAVESWVALGPATSDDGAQALDPLLDNASTDEPACVPGGEANLFIMYTSGTTGLPKGVVHTHSAVLWAALTWMSVMDLRFGDRLWGATPPFHVAAIVPLVIAAQRGLTLVINAKFDPMTAWQAIEAERVTVGGAVPAMLNFMRQVPDFATANLDHLRFFITGAAPMPVELIALYKQRGIDVLQGYSLTETAGGGCYLSSEYAESKAGSTGKAMLYTEVRIVDESGNDTAPGVSGEVLFRGPHLMKEYWANPEATAEVYDSDGWMRTGDIAAMDDDGFVFIKDRVKDMIISGGENVYPAEVENALMSHPGVAEAAVIGQPSEKWGESPFAVVVRATTDLDESALLEHCADRLSRYKLPKGVAFVDEIPRNAAGKVLKKALREHYPGPAPE